MVPFVVDSGRSEFRCLYGGKKISFPAVVGKGKKFAVTNQRSGLRALAFEFENEEHLVGQIALDEDRFCSQARVRDKTSNKNTLIQLAAAGGYILPHDVDAPLIINYNIRDFLAYREDFEKYLQRAFQVRFTLGELAGTIKRFRFPVVSVVPEGLGAMTYAAMNENGSFKRPDLATSRCVLIDLGSQTCNVATFDDLDFIEEFSYAWDLGMYAPESELIEVLNRPPYEYEVNTFADLGNILETKKIHIGATEYDLTREIGAILSEHARKVNEAISQRFRDADRKRVAHVLLAGGGARCMYAHLKPFWPDSSVEVLNNNHDVLDYNRWANCLGQEILARVG